MKTAICLTTAAIFISYGHCANKVPSFQTHPIVADKELLITDIAVVDSPQASYPGQLSFGHLMENLAEPEKTSEFVREWLESWENEQKVNKQPVAARASIRELIIDPWMDKDGFGGLPRKEWKVNLANAPFRLLAIVNRIDVGHFIHIGRHGVEFGSSNSFNNNVPSFSGYGGGSQSNPGLPNTGESRFVFGATDPNGEPLEGGFTVIFEYRLPIPQPHAGDSVIPKETRDRLPAGFGAFGSDDDPPRLSQSDATLGSRTAAARYSADWHALGEHAAFDEAYLCDLISITTRVTDRVGSDAPFLGQLRTNEGAFADVQEAREYELSSEKLKMRPVAGTPALVYNSNDMHFGRAMGRFINSNQRAILSNTHVVPTSFEVDKKSYPFQAGSSLMPKTGKREAKGFRWDLPTVRHREALRTFSMNTCSGCHCGETNTAFYHIAPRRAGEASVLSKFLQIDTDLGVDSLSRRSSKVELNEMGQRVAIFESILNPGYDERKVQSLIRTRLRRAH